MSILTFFVNLRMSTMLLVEARREYTEQLVIFLKAAIYDELYVIWKESIEVNQKDPMMVFQEKLEEIVDWDEKSMIQRTDSCVNKSGCKFIDELITAVFVAHMKILMSVKNDTKKDRYKLQVPTTNKFIYECLMQCSRELWKSPYLFYQNELENKIKRVQMQKNLREVESIISDAIRTTIRSMLPVKEIVGDVLEYDADGDLVLDVIKPKQSTASVPTSTPAPSTSTPPPTPTPTPDENGSGSGVDEPPTDPVEDATHSPDSPLAPQVEGETGSGGGDIEESKVDTTEQPVQDTVQETVHDTAKDSTEESVDKSEELLNSTIENIRTVATEQKEWEYDPDTESVDDWNRGFVLGPVEDDINIESESLEEKDDEVVLDDVVELE